MKVRLLILLAGAGLLATALNANATTKHYSKNMIVMSPSDTPALAQSNSEAMYLRATGYGRTFLYVEANNGKTLDVLDVTNPSKISRVTQASLPARSAYDFELATEDGVLVRYRDGSGQAFMDLEKSKEPTLENSKAYAKTGTDETFQGAIVVTTEEAPVTAAVSDPSYEVFDDSGSGDPKLVASVSGVIQEVERRSTGTLFLLSKSGVTVVRQPEVEQQNADNIIWKQSTN